MVCSTVTALGRGCVKTQILTFAHVIFGRVGPLSRGFSMSTRLLVQLRGAQNALSNSLGRQRSRERRCTLLQMGASCYRSLDSTNTCKLSG